MYGSSSQTSTVLAILSLSLKRQTFCGTATALGTQRQREKEAGSSIVHGHQPDFASVMEDDLARDG
jgi:hypothetical protein